MTTLLLGILLGLIGNIIYWVSYYFQNIDTWEEQGFARAKTAEEKINRRDGYVNWKSKKVLVATLGIIPFLGVFFSSRIVVQILQLHGVDPTDVFWVQFGAMGLLMPGILTMHLIVDRKVRKKNGTV